MSGIQRSTLRLSLEPAFRLFPHLNHAPVLCSLAPRECQIYISTQFRAVSGTAYPPAPVVRRFSAAIAAPKRLALSVQTGHIYRSEEHTSELQSLRHFVC